MLIGQDGKQRFVLKTEQEFVSGFLVHNLTIDEDHTFAVGPDALLVHNTGGCNVPRKPSAQIRKEWEQEMGQPWPKDPETGRNYDVSHIKPLADGGTNGIDNIEPLLHKIHVQRHIDAGDFQSWGARAGGIDE